MSERELQRTNRRIEARVRAMTPALLAIFRRWAQLFERRAMRAGRARKRMRARIAKADTPNKIQKDLETLLRIYGVRQAQSAAKQVGATDIPKTHVQEIESRAVYTAKHLLVKMEKEATRSVNRVIVDSMNEDPPATVDQIARRIRWQFHGQTGGRAQNVRETDATVMTGQTKRLSVNNGVMYAISSERAATIAHTEIGEAEESGKVAGYEALGATHIEWISKQWPQGRHQSMNGQRVKIGKKFRYPDGARGSYPRSPDSPVGHRVNCACTTKPIFADGKKR